jgi:hypothetical protein
VCTGRSGSLRDQPNELTESRNVFDAMILFVDGTSGLSAGGGHLEGMSKGYDRISANGWQLGRKPPWNVKAGKLCRDYARRKPICTCR